MIINFVDHQKKVLSSFEMDSNPFQVGDSFNLESIGAKAEEFNENDGNYTVEEITYAFKVNCYRDGNAGELKEAIIKVNKIHDKLDFTLFPYTGHS